MISCVTPMEQREKTCSLKDIRENRRRRLKTCWQEERSRERKGERGDRTSAEELTFHPFFSAPTVFSKSRDEQPTLQSGIKLWRTRWEAKIKKKNQKAKLRFRLTHFNAFQKKEGKKNWRMHISPRSELDASLLCVDTHSLFHPLPLLIFIWTRAQRSRCRMSHRLFTNDFITASLA